MAQEIIGMKCYAFIGGFGGDWVQLDDVEPASQSYGLSDNKPETRLADIGTFQVSLNNSTGIYTPGVTAGWMQGIPFIANISYYDIASDTTYQKIKFYGTIESIDLETTGDQKTVKIVAVDWLDYSSKYPIVNPALLQNATTDEAITSIIGGMPIPPWDTILDAGNVTFPTVFDTVKGNTKAYAEFAKLANSEIGYIYLNPVDDSTSSLIFNSSSARNGFRPATIIHGTDVAHFDNSFTSIDVEYGKSIINRFTTNVYPKRTDTKPRKLYTTEKEIYLAARETKTFRVFWKDETGKRTINAIPPTGTGHVVSLLHFDTQDGYLYHDELGRTWTSQEADSYITNPKVYGQGAAYFDGSNSYLETRPSPDFNFGSDNFTMEWWESVSGEDENRTTFALPSGVTIPSMQIGVSDGINKLIYLSSDGVNNDIADGKTFGAITYQWTHYALTREGTTFRAFNNGVLTDTWTSSAAIYPSAEPFYLGKNGTNGALASIIDDMRIAKGEALYTAEFTPPTEALTIPQGSYFKMWTGENQSGTDITDNLVASATYGTEGATYTIENNGAYSGYVSINVYGYGIYSDSAQEDTQEDTDSINTYGYQNDGLQQAYQQDLAFGILEGKRVIHEYSQPRLIVNSITFWANANYMHTWAYLTLEVGSVISISSDKHNIDQWYFYIQGIEYSYQSGLIQVTYKVKRAFLLDGRGLSNGVIEFDGSHSGDAIMYGYIPQACNINWIAISTWVHFIDNSGTGGKPTIMSAYKDDGGIYLQILDNKLTFTTNSFSDNIGQWEASAFDWTSEYWNHVTVIYYNGATVLDPLIYINGTLQSITELETPAGTLRDSVGTKLTIGNIHLPISGLTFNGQIKDFRIYNVVKISGWDVYDMAGDLYAAGAYELNLTNGLVFQAFAVYDADYDALIDTSLVEGTSKLIDGFGGCIADIQGTPTFRDKNIGV